MEADVLVVGAGFAGSVAARRLAEAGRSVLVIDRRDHIAGNAHDAYDASGIFVHSYGPHIFHTNNEEVWLYLSRFTKWLPYEHRVCAVVDGSMISLPFNLDSLETAFPGNRAKKLEQLLVGEYGEGSSVPVLKLRESGKAELRFLGEFVYERVFLHYTQKQWGMAPEDLDPMVTARVPVRISRDARYFQDAYQGMPLEGYTAMFQRMLDHPNIKLELGVDFNEARSQLRAGHVFYTGLVDEYYGFRHGKLPYRSLTFDYEYFDDRAQYQSVAVVNYPNDCDYTRITEFKHLTGQAHPGTTIVREYPSDDGEPYYPIPNSASLSSYEPYRKLAARERNVTFVGRLAEYRYLNMDQAVETAVREVEEFLNR